MEKSRKQLRPTGNRVLSNDTGAYCIREGPGILLPLGRAQEDLAKGGQFVGHREDDVVFGEIEVAGDRLLLVPEAGQEATVRELVEVFLKTWGAGSWQDASDPARPTLAPPISVDTHGAARPMSGSGEISLAGGSDNKPASAWTRVH